MIYDITAIDMVKIYFVEYVNNRYFNIDYIYNIRHSENIGDIEPKTLIFITDNDINNGIACLFVAYANQKIENHFLKIGMFFHAIVAGEIRKFEIFITDEKHVL